MDTTTISIDIDVIQCRILVFYDIQYSLKD